MARRRVHSADDLRDIAEDTQLPAEELERDFCSKTGPPGPSAPTRQLLR